MTRQNDTKKQQTLLIYTQVVDDTHPILGFFIGWISVFAKDFARIEVIAMQVGKYDLPDHVTVHSLGKEKGYSKLRQLLNFYRHFGRIYFTKRPQFVFFHMGAIFTILAAPFFFFRGMFGTKFYWWKAHGHVNAFGRFALHFVDRVYTSTESGFASATSKRRVVGQAVDEQLFCLPGIATMRDPYRIIFVGRIMRVKKIEFVLEAFSHIRSEFPDAQLEIIGPIGDGEYFNELLALCDSYDISHTVFVGPKTQNELIAHYQQATYFLNTSLTHSMDKTVLEAIMCGCVPITANRAFATLLGEYGVYIEDATPTEYAKRVIELCHNGTQSIIEPLRVRTVQLHSVHSFSARIFNT